MELHSNVKNCIYVHEKECRIYGMRFKLYLRNWITNRIEIHFVARSKVAITIFGLN